MYYYAGVYMLGWRKGSGCALLRNIYRHRYRLQAEEDRGDNVKPILFNTEMVRAILDGRKTVTRRAIKLDLGKADTDENDSGFLKIPDMYGDFHDAKDLCRYKIGDILWVRETWCKDENGGYVYRTNYGTTDDDSFPPSMFKWRPSIHMPKEAARIFLEVTSVRVERLQDITDKQAKAEGVVRPLGQLPTSEARWFKRLWNSTVKKQDLDRYGWDANPYVWVIEFKGVERGGWSDKH